MKIIAIAGATRLETDLPGELPVETMAMLLGGETGIADAVLSVDGAVLDPKTSMVAAGLSDGCEVHVSPKGAAVPVPAALTRAAQVQEQLRVDPYTMSAVKQNNPPLAAAVESGSLRQIQDVLDRQAASKREAEVARVRLAAAAQANPFDLEVQRQLALQIEQENVEELRQRTLEHMPESFATVVMLYIDVVVNDVPIKAFVDSGAQMTIMSSSMAERCGLMRLCDRRFEGTAVGVGTQKILGRVHMAQLKIGDAFLPTSLSILEDQPMDMLIGLDMLKRHRCSIDLNENVLKIGTTGQTARFLSEAELPESARLHVKGRTGSTSSQNDDPMDGGAAAPAGAPGGAAVSGGAAASFPDATVAELRGLGGFSHAQAIEALTVSSGDVSAAASYLFSLK